MTPASCSSYLSAPLIAKLPPDDKARGRGAWQAQTREVSS